MMTPSILVSMVLPILANPSSGTVSTNPEEQSIEGRTSEDIDETPMDSQTESNTVREDENEVLVTGEDEPESDDPGDQAEAGDQPESEEEPAPPPLSTDELGSAVETPSVDARFWDRIKPTRDRMDPNPYGNTSYTAYALEWGQLRVGVNQTAIGIAPRVQIGTAPALDALRIYNGSLKINAIRARGLDLALQGAYYTLDAGLDATWLRAGVVTSLRLTEDWSLHLASSYDQLNLSGLPQASKISNLLIEGTSEDLAAWEENALREGISFSLEQSMVTARLASDIRFNRRDAIVFQASAILWSSADSAIHGLDPEVEEQLDALPPILNMDNILRDESDLSASISSSYIASIAYQASWRHMELRLGLGVSDIDWAWLLQSIEVSYHFGGETRREETGLRRSWRRNRQIDGS